MQSLFVFTSTPASVLAGGIIPLEQPGRRVTPEIQLASNSVQAVGSPCRGSYFKVSGTVTFTAPVAGLAQIGLYQNGVLIPGIESSATVTTADTQTVTLPIDGIVRVDNNKTGVFTLVNIGVAIDIDNVSLSFVRLF